MKGIEQFIPVVLYIMLCKVVLTFESAEVTQNCDHSSGSYGAVLSCGAVYYAVQVVRTFESVDGIQKCNHSNERVLWRRTFLCLCLFSGIVENLTFPVI